MKKILFLFIVLATLSSCKLKKSMAIYEYGNPTAERVILLPSGQEIPEDYVMIGTCTYGEAGMTPTEICTYEAITRTAMDDARKNWSNISICCPCKRTTCMGKFVL